MKLNKVLVDAAITDGKINAYSIVKSVYLTIYRHYVKLTDIAENNYEWIPAPRGTWPAAGGGSWHGRIGTTAKPNDKDIPLSSLR